MVSLSNHEVVHADLRHDLVLRQAQDEVYLGSASACYRPEALFCRNSSVNRASATR